MYDRDNFHPYLIISLNYREQTRSKEHQAGTSASDQANSKVSDLMNTFEHPSERSSIQFKQRKTSTKDVQPTVLHSSERCNFSLEKPVSLSKLDCVAILVAVWQEGRLCLFDEKCNNLLFRSNSRADLYNHFAEVIFDIYLKKHEKCPELNGKISLNKNQQMQFALDIDGFSDLYSKYTKMMNYLWCQSEL